MSLLHFDLVDSPQGSRARCRAGGFTLLEIQVAMVIFIAAMIGMLGHGRVYKKLLAGLETEYRLDGVVVADEHRAITTIAQAAATSASACELRLHSVEDVDGVTQADVYVTRRAP